MHTKQVCRWNWEVAESGDKRPCRGIWIDWSIEQPAWNWRTPNARLCTWDGVMPDMRLNWERSAWRAVLQKGIWGWQEVQQESAVCALEGSRANLNLECTTHSITSQLKEVIAWSSLYLVLVQFNLNAKILECVPGRTPSWQRAQHSHPWGFRLSALARRRPRGDLTTPYSFLKRGSWEGAAELLSLVPSAVGAAKSWLHQGRFGLDLSKHFPDPKGSETLEQTSCRSGKCPVPVSVEEAFGQCP